MKRIIFSIISIIFCGFASLAIPAKPGFIHHVQPDGSSVKVRMVGDEHGHALYSETGFLLVDNNGFLEYATFDDSGMPESSGVIVNKDNEKSGAASAFQSKIQIERWTKLLEGHRSSRLAKLKRENLSPAAGATRSDPGGNESSGESGLTEETQKDPGHIVPLNFGKLDVSFPLLGEQKGLVILVEYQDEKFRYADFDYFDRMLNEEGFSDYGSLGSARDWFIYNSNGKFLPEFDVFGPVELPYERSYYGKNDAYGTDKNPHMMAVHACEILDDKIDFSQYDRDGDGVIDNVFLFYAGLGEHDSKETDAVWPHSWDVAVATHDREYVFDGVKLSHYACACEYPNGYKRPDGLGTFVHEFSHVMGLPDLYVTISSTGFTPGEWDTLDTGSYNNDGLTPPNYSSFEKTALGWIEPKPFHQGEIILPDFSESDIVYVLPTEKSNEFFFFENRQQYGNDRFIPGHGMLVWHVDYKKDIWEANEVNNISSHQNVDLVEADNIRSEATRHGDSFPGTNNVTEFGFETTPTLASWNKKRLDYEINSITETEEGIVKFNAVACDNNGEGSVAVIETEQKSGNYYDLMGRCVKNPGKGIFILNGKKVIR